MSRASYVFAIAFMAILLLAAAAYAENGTEIRKEDLPPVVLKYFENDYPLAKITKVFSRIDDGQEYFEIESRYYGHQLNVLYKPDGDVIVIKEIEPTRDVSSFVHDGIRKSYPDAKIKRSEKIERWSQITYDVSIRERGRAERRLAVSFDGRITGTRD